MNVTVDICTTPLVKDCDKEGEEICSTQYESECVTSQEKHEVSNASKHRRSKTARSLNLMALYSLLIFI